MGKSKELFQTMRQTQQAQVPYWLPMMQQVPVEAPVPSPEATSIADALAGECVDVLAILANIKRIERDIKSAPVIGKKLGYPLWQVSCMIQDARVCLAHELSRLREITDAMSGAVSPIIDKLSKTSVDAHC
jgi:hypothetical protein